MKRLCILLMVASASWLGLGDSANAFGHRHGGCYGGCGGYGGCGRCGGYGGGYYGGGYGRCGGGCGGCGGYGFYDGPYYAYPYQACGGCGRGGVGGPYVGYYGYPRPATYAGYGYSPRYVSMSRTVYQPVLVGTCCQPVAQCCSPMMGVPVEAVAPAGSNTYQTPPTPKPADAAPTPSVDTTPKPPEPDASTK